MPINNNSRPGLRNSHASRHQMITASQPVPKANYVVPATATVQTKCNSNHATAPQLNIQAN
ncbi:unnamed protein product [Chironomus riparius]|uniref:Uncharacterized protein n=1 Tax=Chironomus riparius TaxID=315576 RepID=A0A9N9RRB6_9DIPT|nr:unnamed protein product [Chironomus riparius]